jgi:hypothetical protein
VSRHRKQPLPLYLLRAPAGFVGSAAIRIQNGGAQCPAIRCNGDQGFPVRTETDGLDRVLERDGGNLAD